MLYLAVKTCFIIYILNKVQVPLVFSLPEDLGIDGKIILEWINPCPYSWRGS